MLNSYSIGLKISANAKDFINKRQTELGLRNKEEKIVRGSNQKYFLYLLSLDGYRPDIIKD